MRRWVIAWGLVTALCAPATADELTDEPELPAQDSFGDHLKDKVNLLSDEVALRLNTITLDLFDMDFDMHSRVARLRLGGGDDERFSLRLNSHVLFQSGYARVNARIDLSVVGTKLSFEVPEFDMAPKSWAGERYVEFRLPLLKGSF